MSERASISASTLSTRAAQLHGACVARGERVSNFAFEAEVARVEHHRVDVGEHLGEVLLEHVALQVGRERHVVLARHLGRSEAVGRRGGRPRLLRRVGAGHACRLVVELRDQRRARFLVFQALRELQPGHRVLRVRHQAAVLGRDAQTREAVRERGAAHQDRALDAVAREVLRGDDHLLRALDEQAGQADRVGTVLLIGGYQIFGRHLDAEVHDLVAVVLEDDLDQVLADVVHVALHGGEHDAARARAFALLHELLEVRDGGLHRLGRLQHLGDDHLVVVEAAGRPRPCRPSAGR
jgi:hypothetical protein